MIFVPKEASIKERLGRWLESHGCVVYDERRNPRQPHWGVFEVEDAIHGNPDLVIRCQVKREGFRYVAVEVKPCHKHKDLLDGFDAVLQYFSDICFGAKYEVDGSSIQVQALALATDFSPKGYLFKEERRMPKNMVKAGGWDATPSTFTFVRLLWRQRDNILKRIVGMTETPLHLDRFPWKIRKRGFPEVAVLIRHPTKESKLILWTTENAYHGVEIEADRSTPG